jgi:hypothetical protein
MMNQLRYFSVIHPTGDLAAGLQVEGDRESQSCRSKIYVTLLSSIVCFTLIFTLSELPWAVQLFLMGVMTLVFYGTVAARFSDLRRWLVVCIVMLAIANLCYGFVSLHVLASHQDDSWRHVESEELEQAVQFNGSPHAEHYQLLENGLFIKKDYWLRYSIEPKNGSRINAQLR